MRCMGDDVDTLRQLNEGYVGSAERSDVRWYEAHLAADFMSANPDGSLVDRAGFLARKARPYPGSKRQAEDVRIRIIGEMAIIHAGFKYLKPDGAPGAGRYTGIWSRRDGRWLCVAAHFTRI